MTKRRAPSKRKPSVNVDFATVGSMTHRQLKRNVPMVEAGMERLLPLHEAIAKQVVRAAMKGDAAATAFILGVADQLAEQPPKPKSVLDGRDQKKDSRRIVSAVNAFYLVERYRKKFGDLSIKQRSRAGVRPGTLHEFLDRDD